MSLFEAFVLGVVQGLTEFLPISSSAHLALAPWLLGWRDPGLAFDVALHIGTLAAVFWFFRAEWKRLVLGAVALVRAGGRPKTIEEWRVVFLVIATIPAAIGGILLEDYAETVFRSPYVMGVTLVVMGALLWAADRWLPATRALDQMTWKDALLVGCAQVLALVPGVSRSGSTITAARALRLDRQSAAVFSFLMSMPITSAAVVLKFGDAISTGGSTLPLAVGIVSAWVSAVLAIKVMLRYVSSRSYGIFGAYRIVFGLFVLWLASTRG